MTVINPDDLMTETQVYEKYKGLFADRELREARRSGQIEFYDLRKGVHYSPEQVTAYLNSKVKRKCKNAKLDNDQEPETTSAPEKQSGFSKAGDRRAHRCALKVVQGALAHSANDAAPFGADGDRECSGHRSEKGCRLMGALKLAAERPGYYWVRCRRHGELEIVHIYRWGKGDDSGQSAQLYGTSDELWDAEFDDLFEIVAGPLDAPATKPEAKKDSA